MAELPAAEFEQYWRCIQVGIDKVVAFYADGLPAGQYPSGPLTMAEYFNIYTVVYQVSSNYHQGYSSELYNRYKTFCQEYLGTKVLQPARAQSGELMLREVVKGCRSYKNVTRLVSRLFSYLDEYYTKKRAYESLPDVALIILQEKFYDEMKKPIIDAVLKLIREDRDGNPSDLSLVKEVLETVYDPESQASKTSYQTDFEPEFRDASCVYYLSKFKNWSETLLANEYASKVVECMKAERSRAEQFLYPSTISELAKVIVPEVQNPYWSIVISLGRRVEQLEQAAANNVVHAMDELTINDATDASEKKPVDDDISSPKDGDNDNDDASDETMEDEYVMV